MRYAEPRAKMLTRIMKAVLKGMTPEVKAKDRGSLLQRWPMPGGPSDEFPSKSRRRAMLGILKSATPKSAGQVKGKAQPSTRQSDGEAVMAEASLETADARSGLEVWTDFFASPKASHLDRKPWVKTDTQKKGGDIVPSVRVTSWGEVVRRLLMTWGGRVQTEVNLHREVETRVSQGSLKELTMEERWVKGLPQECPRDKVEVNLQVALVFWKILSKAILRKTDFEIAVDVALTQRRCAVEEKGDTSQKNTLKAIAAGVLQQGNRW